MSRLLSSLILSACLAMPACAQIPTSASRVLQLSAQDISPHLQRHFPMQLQSPSNPIGLTLSRPGLSLAGPRALLSADVALGLSGSTLPLGRATFSSGLRVDTASAQVFLDQPRLQSMLSADGQAWTPDPSLTAMLAAAMDQQAQRTPIYSLPASYKHLAARVGTISIGGDSVRIHLQ